MRQHKWIVASAVMLCLACLPSRQAFETSLHRFGDRGTAVVVVSVPDHVRVVTSQATLAGGAEVDFESAATPVDFTNLATSGPTPLARVLASLADVDIAAADATGPWVTRMSADPRRAGQRGYRLLPAFVDTPPPRDPLAPPPPDEHALDDRTGRRYLVRSSVPVDNLPRPLWYDLGPKSIARHFDIEFLLLVSLEHVTVLDTGARPEVHVGVAGFVVDLQRPLLAAAIKHEFTIAVDSPAGVEAALCGTLAQLRADDWRPLRASLSRLGERYGYLLAADLGWLDDTRLAQLKATWLAENEAALPASLR